MAHFFVFPRVLRRPASHFGSAGQTSASSASVRKTETEENAPARGVYRTGTDKLCDVQPQNNAAALPSPAGDLHSEVDYLRDFRRVIPVQLGFSLFTITARTHSFTRERTCRGSPLSAALAKGCRGCELRAASAPCLGEWTPPPPLSKRTRDAHGVMVAADAVCLFSFLLYPRLSVGAPVRTAGVPNGGDVSGVPDKTS